MKELSYNNKHIFYEKLGKSVGETLVFLHGFMENISLWKSFLNRFIYKYQVLMVDLPGHGASDCISDIHTMDLMAEVVHLIFQKEQVSKAHFIGHSMGGYVALAFAEHYPQELKSITLLNSTALPDSDEKKKNRDRTIEAVQRNKKIFVRTAITNLFSKENQEKQTEIIDKAISDIENTTICGITAASKGMQQRTDKTNLLAELSVPKFYIVGESDGLFSISEIIAEAEKTKSDYALIPGGHMSFLECPEITQKTIEKFIENA